MFICYICEKPSQPNEKQTKKVVKTRPAIYKHLDEKGYAKPGKGTEIVKEVSICPRCAAESKVI